jgi:hypothetical protein
MDNNVAVIDVTNLEDCRDKKQYQTLREIFKDAREQIAQGRDVVLHQTFQDSPPELVERIQTHERLEEVAGYYLAEDSGL